MQVLLTNKFLFVLVAAALSFGVAFPAAAESPRTDSLYDGLEIEIEIEDGVATVDVEYKEDGEEVDKEFTYNETSVEKVKEKIAADLNISVSEVIAATKKIEVDDSSDDDDDDRETTKAEAEEEIAEAEAAIARLEDKIEDADSGVKTMTEKLNAAKAYLADAEYQLDNGKYEMAEVYAEKAERQAKIGLGEEDEDDNVKGDDKRPADFCEKTAQANGWGVAKKCDDQKTTDKVEWKRDKSEYGKGDVAELQQQLRELLTLLIQLLQQQQVLLNAAS